MARRKKSNGFMAIMYILLIVLIFFLVYSMSQDKNDKTVKDIINNDNNSTKKENKENIEKKVDTNNEDKDEKTQDVKSNNVTSNASSDEKIENKNENNRRGGNVTLDLIGEENITISLGSNYNDEGVKAYYDDGTDASSEVEVDNSVDTTKSGTYTVTYYAGNSVVIRRVTVE